MGHDDHGEVHDHDRGLAFVLGTLMTRANALRLIAGAGLLALAGCGSSSTREPSAAASTADPAAEPVAGTSASCETIPEETAGPYPADGSNGVNVLTESGIVRADLRPSFGAATGVAEGVPLTVTLTVLDAANGCAPLAGAAVYLWHCDREGRYSLYDQGVAEENYLRGVQETDAQGVVAFTTVFPGCYAGRWPHMHFEVYPTVDEATRAGTETATSQLALPADACATVYASDGYDESRANLEGTSLRSDNVFADGAEAQLTAVTGSVEAGYAAALAVPV